MPVFLSRLQIPLQRDPDVFVFLCISDPSHRAQGTVDSEQTSVFNKYTMRMFPASSTFITQKNEALFNSFKYVKFYRLDMKCYFLIKCLLYANHSIRYLI